MKEQEKVLQKFGNQDQIFMWEFSRMEDLGLEMWDGRLLAAWNFLLHFRYLPDSHVGIIFLTSDWIHLALGWKSSHFKWNIKGNV